MATACDDASLDCPDCDASMRILKAAAAVIVTILGGVLLGIVANRNHIDFTPVAFASAATILAFLLPGAALVGPYIAEELQASATQIQELVDKATEASAKDKSAQSAADAAPTDKEKEKAASDAKDAATRADTASTSAKKSTKVDFGKLLDCASWLQAGLACAFVSVPVSAAALVIGPAGQGQTAPDSRGIVGAIAITLLIGTAIGIVPITWRILYLKTYRSWAKGAFA
jgi:hypothetical protein